MRHDEVREPETTDLLVSRCLPDSAIGETMTRIVIPECLQTLQSNFLVLLEATRRGRILPGAGQLHGVMGYVGPPGCGKSTLAEGLANQFARRNFERDETSTVLFELRASQVFSEALGKSAKGLESAFDSIRFAARRGPTVLLMNEVESTAFSRAQLATGDPTDVHRTSNLMLTGLDSIVRAGSTLVLWTSNFHTKIDSAFIDRTDHVIHMDWPDSQAARQILTRTAKAYAKVCCVPSDVIEDALQQLFEDGKTPGLSGRDLDRIIPLALIRFGVSSSLSADRLVCVARDLLNRRSAHGAH